MFNLIKDGKGHSIVLINRHFADLNPIDLGYEYCLPGKSFGPTSRNYTLIHYVVSGKGKIIKKSGAYEASEGQAFLIRPGEVSTYIADANDPWYYQWIAFDGTLSEKFVDLDHVISFPKGLIQEMLDTEGKNLQEYRVAALLFKMYIELFEGKKSYHHYVRRVQDHIRAAYMYPLRVEEIACKMNLDRRYLSRMFKERTGRTIQEYLIEVRIEESKKLLEQGFSVEQSAQMCGYDDACNFSKMFKRKVGISPIYWKNEQMQNK